MVDQKLSAAIKRFQEQKPYELADMMDNGVRDRKIQERLLETQQKRTGGDLTFVIETYFKSNRTMSGEKGLKEVAGAFREFIKYNPFTEVDGIMEQKTNGSSVRDKMIDQYAKVCVKQAKVKDVDLSAVDMEGLRVNKLSTHKYEIQVEVFAGQMFAGDKRIGDVDPKFLENHRATDGKEASLIVEDYSNGKLNNLSCRMIIDLGQEQSPELELVLERPTQVEDEDTVDPVVTKKASKWDDFVKAVNSIPMPDKESEKEDLRGMVL